MSSSIARITHLMTSVMFHHDDASDDFDDNNNNTYVDIVGDIDDNDLTLLLGPGSHSSHHCGQGEQ